ncbi:Peptidase M16 domain [Syntrophomonas zehnderi OL-4]|uniref:Peptidase M16 domain n=1 Tax=Syntrophomonas zehnderi OL-4 TaxID=690567 RepID=A0A0E4C8U3_9FIRM|nr:pitrilysin family protein [Syntrophomonas zehnderi]CFX68131.1 Peptidase M16 domain [Syntrophomonas zehnderi OL-4]
MINCWRLSSGGKLVVEEIPYLKSAAIGVYIKVGSRNETPDIAGASHFVEHMLFKGTAKRTARQIAETFEGMGGQLNAFTSKEYTGIYARTLDEDIYKAIEIICDMLFDSQFNERDFLTEKGVVIEEINMYEDTPDELIHDVFAQKFWEGHPLGYPVLGTLDSITGMEREVLYQYYRKNYLPSNMVFAVAGNVDHQKIQEAIEKLTGSLNGQLVPSLLEIPEPAASFINLLPKDVEQVQICMGVPGLSYHSDDRYAQNVMNSILGGGMSSRLFQSLREEMGLAYSVYSYSSNYADAGMYTIYIGTGPSKVASFYEALNEQLSNFVNQGVSSEEVERTQKLIKSSIYLGLESVMNRMTRVARSLLMYDEIVTPEEVIDRIYAVDVDKVNELARQMLRPDYFSLAAIGDKQALKSVEQEYMKWWR